jgi:hypothetical protein
VHDDAAPRLQVLPLLPADWSAGQRNEAAAWLRHTVAQSGWRGQTGLVVHDVDPAGGIVRLAGIAIGNGTSCVTLMVACASHVGAGTVARWSSERMLFTAAQPQGMMPGEGAAGLLVSSASLAAARDGQAVALLMPVEAAQTDTLENLADYALAQAHVEPADVAMIVADMGHRSRHVQALIAYASTAMRQLDGSEDVVRLGAAGGNAGIVPFVAGLALASHYAAERKGIVLCIADEVPGCRLATLVRPAA